MLSERIYQCGVNTCTNQAVILTVEVLAAVAHHGVDQDLIDRQFAASKAFFALPLGMKLKLKVRSHALLSDCNMSVDRLLHRAAFSYHERQ